MRPLTFVLLMIFLSACEQAATPFPVDVPTAPPATATVDPARRIRYALAPNIEGTYTVVPGENSPVEVTQLNEPVDLADLGPRFDMIVAYGAYDDAVPSPTMINYALLLNTGLAPLDEPEIAQIVRQTLDPVSLTQSLDIPGIQTSEPDTQPLAALQTALANAGWPDGFDLSLGHNSDLLAVDALHQQFQAVNIRLNSQPLDQVFANYHLAYVTWTTMRERNTWAALPASEDDMIELFAVPISYWAVPDLKVAFSALGWPVPLLD